MFCIPIRGTQVPAGPEWLHEIKYDGFRVLVQRDGDRVRLITRGGYDWAKRYPWIVQAALKNRHRRASSAPSVGIVHSASGGIGATHGDAGFRRITLIRRLVEATSTRETICGANSDDIGRKN